MFTISKKVVLLGLTGLLIVIALAVTAAFLIPRGKSAAATGVPAPSKPQIGTNVEAGSPASVSTAPTEPKKGTAAGEQTPVVVGATPATGPKPSTRFAVASERTSQQPPLKPKVVDQRTLQLEAQLRAAEQNPTAALEEAATRLGSVIRAEDKDGEPTIKLPSALRPKDKD